MGEAVVAAADQTRDTAGSARSGSEERPRDTG